MLMLGAFARLSEDVPLAALESAIVERVHQIRAMSFDWQFGKSMSVFPRWLHE